MALDPITAAFDFGSDLIKRIFPDPEKRAEAIQSLERLKQNGELAKMKMQSDINIQEAKSASVFVSGARPFILWICGAGFGYSVIIYPLLCWGWALLQATGHIPKGIEPPPEIDSGALFTMLSGLLGLGSMRTVEKIKGVARSKVKN